VITATFPSSFFVMAFLLYITYNRYVLARIQVPTKK